MALLALVPSARQSGSTQTAARALHAPNVVPMAYKASAATAVGLNEQPGITSGAANAIAVLMVGPTRTAANVHNAWDHQQHHLQASIAITQCTAAQPILTEPHVHVISV